MEGMTHLAKLYSEQMSTQKEVSLQENLITKMSNTVSAIGTSFMEEQRQNSDFKIKVTSDQAHMQQQIDTMQNQSIIIHY